LPLQPPSAVTRRSCSGKKTLSSSSTFYGMVSLMVSFGWLVGKFVLFFFSFFFFARQVFLFPVNEQEQSIRKSSKQT
jgi:hypothetical protein